MVTQLKWFISTIIVAVSGLAIIGVVIYSSMHGSGGESVFKTLEARGAQLHEASRCQQAKLS